MDKKGILYGLGAYGLWGLFPIYWKWLHGISALQLIGHRIGWSFIFLGAVIIITRQWQDFRSLAFKPRVLLIYGVAGVLLGINWFIYVWAVNEGFIVETSLGYFINPLISMLLGMFFLHEKLRIRQWVPIALAAAGVGYLTFVYGRPPWIALALAFSFGTYGLVKKLAPLGSLYGLTLETGILFLPAVAYLIFVEMDGTAAFLHGGAGADLLMVGAGVVTTVPLLMFASAAKRIPLTMIGVLQYIAPTMQFLIGVLVYKEPFDRNHLIGFGIIWTALILFWVENYFSHRNPSEPVAELGEG